VCVCRFIGQQTYCFSAIFPIDVTLKSIVETTWAHQTAGKCYNFRY